MKPIRLLAFLAILVAAPLATFAAASPAAAPAASAPTGWKQHLDASTDASDPDAAGEVKIVNAGTGFHIETPVAAVFWHPTNQATGNYTLKGEFVLNKPSTHQNFYGFVFGGSGLEGASQKYTYFMVAQTGAWIAKTRNGATTAPAFTGIVGASRTGAVINTNVVKMPVGNGKSTNIVEIRVQSDKVDFAINGTVVHSAPKAGLVTDGIWGLRSNHILDIGVDHISLTH